MLAEDARPPRRSGTARARTSRRALLILLLVLLLSAGACTYGKEEPGLFSQRRAESSSPPVPEPSPTPPAPTNPDLPVAGQRVWVSADGLGVQTRLAVHAIRRIPGATVLDWSVTPLTARGLRPGDRVPAGVSLGLTRESHGDVAIFLVDSAHAKVYRPLSHRSAQEFHRCLCSPVWVAQLSLRVGETRLLQVTYPALPPAVQFLDVHLATVPPFAHVPVTGVDQAPVARHPTNLAWAPQPSLPLGRPVRFTYPSGQSRRSLGVTVEKVIAAPTFTSVAWTITSLTQQTGFGLLPVAPPLAAVLPAHATAVSQNAVSGLRLKMAGRSGPVLQASWMTESFENLGFVECLCTELGLWSSALRDRGGQVTVTTNYPALPAGVTTVDVLLSGVPPITDLPVTPAANGALQTGPPRAVPHSPAWSYLPDNPPRGWSTSQWPTPLPALGQLRSYVATVEDVVDLSR